MVEESLSYQDSEERMAKSKEEEEEDMKLLLNGEAVQANVRSVNFR